MSCGEHRCSEFACGFATARSAGDRFTKELIEAGTIGKNYDVWTTKDIEKYESISQKRKSRDIGIYHSLGFLALIEDLDKWPQSHAFIISPPTPKPLHHMIAGGGNVLKNLAIGSRRSARHRKLLQEGIKETVTHPLSTVKQGLKGVHQDAIGKIHNSYVQLDRENKPEVHVIVSSRETLFSYDEKFAAQVISAGFKLYKVDTGHNAPHTRPEEVAGVVLSVLNED